MKFADPSVVAQKIVLAIEESGLDKVLDLPSTLIARAMLRGLENNLHFMSDVEQAGLLDK